MTDYWLDANFFIPAQKFPHHLTTFQKLIGIIGTKKDKYTLKITKRVSYEVKGFLNLIRVHFETIPVENTPEFRTFCKETKFAIGSSKERDDPADSSLAYAAEHSGSPAVLVSNDEGFLRVKRAKPHLLKNVEIIEPTTFLRDIMLEVEDNDFREDIRALILHYSEHFITYRLETDRSISRILESLLVVDNTFSTIASPESSMEPSADIIAKKKNRLPHADIVALENYISGQELTAQEQDRLGPVLSIFEPFVAYYKSKDNDPHNKTHDNITGFLYLKYPELHQELRQLVMKEKADENDILEFGAELERFLRVKMFNIRTKETIRYFRECYFEKAFFHFKTLLESDLQVVLNDQKKSILKFLYGIFLLNIKDFSFLEYLFNNGFWDGLEHISNIFKTLLKIVNGSVSEQDIQGFSDSNLKLFYNLGNYYANSGSPFGLNIFDVLFWLDAERFEGLDWGGAFLNRYVLELRVNQREITDAMKDKFLRFLEPNSLVNNTKSTFDRNYELTEFTPIEKAHNLYKQQHYLISAKKHKKYIEAYSWNDNIKSIVIINIPVSLQPHLENVRTLEIKSGNIKTKKIPFMDKRKKKARMIIELAEDCQLDEERFKIEVRDIF